MLSGLMTVHVFRTLVKAAFAVLLLAFFSLSSFAEEEKEKDKGEKTVETEHVVTIDGKELSYTATAGTLPITNKRGKVTASIFYTAYTLKDGGERSERPITFSFNGGPGSSSVWMHMGLLGPVRVALDEEGMAPSPPFYAEENPYSLLDKSDLVFIDPVSTGYSRASSPKKVKKFHGFDGDVESVSEFIRLYTTRNERWGSPKFLIGESYGTVRAVAVSEYLMDKHRIYLNGIMLVSSVLSWQTLTEDSGNDLPFIVDLPTQAAAAWHHRKLSSELQAKELEPLLREVEVFAQGDYLVALFEGNALPPGKKLAIAEKLAYYTGLDAELILKHNLRVKVGVFRKLLCADEKSVIGSYDVRYKGPFMDERFAWASYDPSMSEIEGAYASVLNRYIREELKYEEDYPYEILTSKVQPWNWEPFENRYLNVAQKLAKVMTRNKSMKVHVSNGYFDLVTPYFATLYSFKHIPLAEPLQKNIVMDFYDAGHMMYLRLKSLKKQKNDLARFIDLATSEIRN